MKNTIIKFPEVREGSIFCAGTYYRCFWQVTRRTNSTVWVRQITGQTGKVTSRYNNYIFEMYNKNRFVSGEVKCQLLTYNKPCIRPSFDYAFLYKENHNYFNYNS